MRRELSAFTVLKPFLLKNKIDITLSMRKLRVDDLMVEWSESVQQGNTHELCILKFIYEITCSPIS